MKVKVIKKFRDKHTRSILEPGQILDIDKKRFEEINSTSFGVFVEEIEEKPTTKQETNTIETKESTKKEEKAKPKNKSTKK